MEDFYLFGLGNDAPPYYLTRHNMGFIFLDYVSKVWQAAEQKTKCPVHWATAEKNGLRIHLVRPKGYINLSGEAILAFCNYYKISFFERSLVLCDDLDQPFGQIKFREKGSSGGHNGLKNIIERLGGQDFPRLKFGIGKPPHPSYPVADWVLTPFAKGELEALAETILPNGLERLENYLKTV